MQDGFGENKELIRKLTGLSEKIIQENQEKIETLNLIDLDEKNTNNQKNQDEGDLMVFDDENAQ